MSELTNDMIMEAKREADAAHAFWTAHYADLLRKYPEQFVAVARADRRVVAVDANHDRLIEKVKAAGLDWDQVWVRFITDYSQPVLL